MYGLRKEKNGKALQQNLQDLLRSSLEIKDNVHITRSFRVKQKQSNVSICGNAKKPSLPPVVISGSKELDILTIMKSVGKLKGSALRICTDLPPTLNAIRAQLLAKAKALKDSKKYTYIQLRQIGTVCKLEYCNTSNEQWLDIDDGD